MQQTNFFKCRPLRYRIRYLTEPRQTSSKRFRDAKTLAVADLVLYKARQCMRKSGRRGRECDCLIAKGDRSAIGRLQVCCFTGLTRRPTKRTREEKTRPAGGHISLHSWSCTIKKRPRALSGYCTQESLVGGQLAAGHAVEWLRLELRYDSWLPAARVWLCTRGFRRIDVQMATDVQRGVFPHIRYCNSKQKTSVERLCEMVSQRNTSPSTQEFDGRARNAYRRHDSFVLVQWQLHNEESVHS
ncbi:Hypothetical_protein [Hexamita inflata]|uniref:Hypothetical_protein n=1 Tax=Hexamita inflata TaxID=28002 RepID=A0AA86TXQ9_9EUKA|nr:Hypothetical protein HINF_LOCUS18617 [Hexamita inflata]